MAASAGSNPGEAAAAIREQVGLEPTGPIPDILAVAENTMEVPVGVIGMGEGIAGAYIVRRDRPFILVNGRDFKYRRRFTLAHELGHHVLGHAAIVDNVATIEGRTQDPRELEANEFAGALLAPDAALRALMEQWGHPALTINTLVQVANDFGISSPAAYVRLRQAGILVRRDQIARLKGALSHQQHLGAVDALGLDPFEDELTAIKQTMLPRLPAAMMENALEAYQAGLITLDELAAKLGRPRGEVEAKLAAIGIAPAPLEEPDW